MATDPYKYRCTPSEAEELHTSRVLGLNIWRSGPVPENVRQLPIAQANVVPFDRAYAVRMLDDDDGNARWTSEDAIYLHRILNLPPPRLHPAAEPLNSILDRMDGYDRSRIHGVNTTYLPRTIQPPRPAEAGRMSEANEAKFDPARDATIESSLQALREQQRPDEDPSPSQQAAPVHDVANATTSPETTTTPERNRMWIGSLLSPTEADEPPSSSENGEQRSTGTVDQPTNESQSLAPVSNELAQPGEGTPAPPVTSDLNQPTPPIEPSPGTYQPPQGMPSPALSKNSKRPSSSMPSRYPPAPIYPSLPPPPVNPTPLRQMSNASNLNDGVSNSLTPAGGTQVNSGRVTKPSSQRHRGGGLSPARQDIFNRFFEEQRIREAAGQPPPPPRMSDFYDPPGTQTVASPASSAPMQTPQPARLGVADGANLPNAGMQSNSSSVWAEGEQDPKLKNGRLSDVTDPEYEAVIDEDEPEWFLSESYPGLAVIDGVGLR